MFNTERLVAMIVHNGQLIVATEKGVYLLEEYENKNYAPIGAFGVYTVKPLQVHVDFDSLPSEIRGEFVNE